jgi:hypothetical protein
MVSMNGRKVRDVVPTRVVEFDGRGRPVPGAAHLDQDLHQHVGEIS